MCKAAAPPREGSGIRLVFLHRDIMLCHLVHSSTYPNSRLGELLLVLQHWRPIRMRDLQTMVDLEVHDKTNALQPFHSGVDRHWDALIPSFRKPWKPWRTWKPSDSLARNSGSWYFDYFSRAIEPTKSRNQAVEPMKELSMRVSRSYHTFHVWTQNHYPIYS